MSRARVCLGREGWCIFVWQAKSRDRATRFVMLAVAVVAFDLIC